MAAPTTAAGAGGRVECVESAETGAGTNLNVEPGNFFTSPSPTTEVDSGFLKTAN